MNFTSLSGVRVPPHWTGGGPVVRLIVGSMLLCGATAGAATPTQGVAVALTEPARRLVAWIGDHDDHGRRPFVVIDKQAARLWAFGADLSPRGSTPVLLGAARGDHSVVGIGDRPLAQVRPHERTTPAGRFPVEAGVNTHGEDIFWVDYDAAVSMHRVRAHVQAERRLQRLASPSPADNRISYGCINVPAPFYDGVLRPLLSLRAGTAYVLPEVLPLGRVFPGLKDGSPAASPMASSTRTQASPTWP